MRQLLPILFEAGALLLTDRAARKGEGGSACATADIFLQCNLWPVLFGAMYHYLIWYEELSFRTDCLGCFPTSLRDLHVKTLLTIAVVLFVCNATEGAELLYHPGFCDSIGAEEQAYVVRAARGQLSAV